MMRRLLPCTLWITLATALSAAAQQAERVEVDLSKDLRRVGRIERVLYSQTCNAPKSHFGPDSRQNSRALCLTDPFGLTIWLGSDPGTNPGSGAKRSVDANSTLPIPSTSNATVSWHFDFADGKMDAVGLWSGHSSCLEPSVAESERLLGEPSNAQIRTEVSP
jgi:hypothetical protein